MLVLLLVLVLVLVSRRLLMRRRRSATSFLSLAQVHVDTPNRQSNCLAFLVLELMFLMSPGQGGQTIED